MKSKNNFLVVLMILTVISTTSAQWTNEWTSSQIESGVVSGWLNFEQVGNDWNTRLYSIDSLSFQIMQDGYSGTPQYSYTFTPSERLAGSQVYSLAVDLTGDNITEFYVLGYDGSGSPYRQSFKILDIITNTMLLEKNDPNYSFTFPSISDVDNDDILEAVFSRYDYPALTNYALESFNTGVATSVTTDAPIMRFEMEQNYPNPFNPSTTIKYYLNISDNVKLQIFDIKGEMIKTLVNDFQNSGEHEVIWNGTNSRGEKLTSGVYFYSITADDNISTKKMILLK